MTALRLQACAPAAAFAALAWVVAGTGRVPTAEALLAAVSIALAIVPSGCLAPGGWRRRAAEALVVPPALALVFVADPTLREMSLPPLLVVAAMATGSAALRIADRRDRWVVIVGLALGVRAACGMGLAGYPAWRVALVIAFVFAVAGLAGRVLNPGAALLVAASAGVAPLERVALLPLAVLAAAATALVVAAARATWTDRLASAWRGAVVAVVVVVASLAPWGGIGVGRAFPTAGWIPVAAGGVALAATVFAPPAIAGAAWLGIASLLGEPLPPPPDRPGVELTAANPNAVLPVSDGGLYVVDLSVANATALPQGTVVAVVRDVGPDVPIRVGIETAEWAHERDDVRRNVAHALPANSVWRPVGYGNNSTWAVAGRITWELSKGIRPRLARAAGLPPEVHVGVGTAGTSRPTLPRDWPATSWILAAAMVVAALQLTSSTWRSASAWVPWALLVTIAVAVRSTVAPLDLLAERHSVDVALAALLAAWFPAARVWLRRGYTFIAAAALLVPLAVATSHTMEAGGDAQYHLIVLRSLAEDHDLDLSNNYDLEHHPGNKIYVTPAVLHSPVLDFMLLPGYLASGMPGALVVIAFCGALLVAVVARAAQTLGLPQRRRALLVSALLLTYPLATYATQIWVEVPGALLAALAMLSVTTRRRSVGGAALASLAATGLKTRLALATFPVPLLALAQGRRRGRELLIPMLALVAAIGAGLAFGVLLYGHALGPFRHLGDLVPSTLRQPFIVLGGLAFDVAGGLVFSAPLLAMSLGGTVAAWKRGGPAVRGLLLAGVATVGALLSSPEWYGGGCPPLRYLVPLLPAFAICGTYVLRGFSRWRRALYLMLPPSFIVWWTMVTRPHVGFNPGDGGSWIADALARRFAADARHLFPSFLRPSPATVIAPLVIGAIGAGVLLIAQRKPAAGRGLARATVAVWLLVASSFVLMLTLRDDRVVEIEDPQVAHLGGSPEPPLGTFGRFVYSNGWRIRDGEGVEVPLRLPTGARLRLEGWLEGPAQGGADLGVRWDGAATRSVPVRGIAHGSVELPPPGSGGRHELTIVLASPPGGEAVLDRLVVTP